ncbi:hypothetical protein [Halococcus sp. IIIV-5B]|uniref:hypothetical protein n=1 Tax=Halococcus sp. IIIV-5B TaxID=2321230 RepID=UPI001F3F7A95|nr:hypothetical protein [Halococcus sp. IIIV-5B]
MVAQSATGIESTGTSDVEQLLEDISNDNPLKSVVIDLLDRVERVELARNAAHKRIDELEARLSDSEPQGKSGEGGSQNDMTPIERVSKADEHDDATMGHVTASVERAVSIFDHFEEWSSKAPKGRVITGNLRNLLTTATGESLAWKQVYRACRKLEEWSKGRIAFEKTRRHGWILVEQSSSVSGG